MLLNYKFENYLSFRESVTFSMAAPKTRVKKRYPNNYVSAGQGCDILKSAVIAGENAGGKSNFVSSLQYLRSFFQENKEPEVYRSKINVDNNAQQCWKKCHSLQRFEVEIYIRNIGFYYYHLQLDFAGIVTEKLSYKSHNKKRYTQILSIYREACRLPCAKDERGCPTHGQCETKASANCRVEFSGSIAGMEEVLEMAVNTRRKMGLAVTKLAVLGDEHAINFTDWMRNRLCPLINVFDCGLFQSLENEEDNLRIIQDSRFMDIFRLIDPAVTAVAVDGEKPFSKSYIIRKKEDGKTYFRELSQDSSGIREYFFWAVQIFKVVYEDKIVFADAMDRALNPRLSADIVTLIHTKDHYGQFVFTTHNFLHLNLKIYMKEQINFISKDTKRLASKLYSLAEVPRVRYETAKIYEFYLKGKLGGNVIEQGSTENKENI
ncbi:ATP-binding protein [Lachnospiraceae bacterium]|nr:ATP-binding protein [Lachnospiraceae bacterium]